MHTPVKSNNLMYKQKMHRSSFRLVLWPDWKT